MIGRLWTAAAGFALLQIPALADTQHLGTITMYLCDSGLDLCSNTLSSSPINLPEGPFSEQFVFDFVNTFPNVPDNVPLARAIALLQTSSGADFSSTSVMLYNSFDLPIGFNTPFAPNGTNYQARAEDLILPGTGYYVQVDGIANVDNLPLQVSVSAFDLGPSRRARVVDLGHDARRLRRARRDTHSPRAEAGHAGLTLAGSGRSGGDGALYVRRRFADAVTDRMAGHSRIRLTQGWPPRLRRRSRNG